MAITPLRPATEPVPSPDAYDWRSVPGRAQAERETRAALERHRHGRPGLSAS